MWTLWLACAPPAPAPGAWPQGADEAATLRLEAARTYLDALGRSVGDPPDALVDALGDAGTRARRGPDAEARALLADWLLDAEVRRASRGARSLRDVVAAAPTRVDLPGWHATAEEVAGEPLPRWTAQDLAEGPLDYGAALHWFGVAWVDDPGGARRLVADPGAAPQARKRRADWR
jgi:hypothetical protein